MPSFPPSGLGRSRDPEPSSLEDGESREQQRRVREKTQAFELASRRLKGKLELIQRQLQPSSSLLPAWEALEVVEKDQDELVSLTGGEISDRKKGFDKKDFTKSHLSVDNFDELRKRSDPSSGRKQDRFSGQSQYEACYEAAFLPLRSKARAFFEKAKTLRNFDNYQFVLSRLRREKPDVEQRRRKLGSDRAFVQREAGERAESKRAQTLEGFETFNTSLIESGICKFFPDLFADEKTVAKINRERAKQELHPRPLLALEGDVIEAYHHARAQGFPPPHLRKLIDQRIKDAEGYLDVVTDILELSASQPEVRESDNVLVFTTPDAFTRAGRFTRSTGTFQGYRVKTETDGSESYERISVDNIFHYDGITHKKSKGLLKGEYSNDEIAEHLETLRRILDEYLRALRAELDLARDLENRDEENPPDMDRYRGEERGRLVQNEKYILEDEEIVRTHEAGFQRDAPEIWTVVQDLVRQADNDIREARKVLAGRDGKLNEAALQLLPKDLRKLIVEGVDSVHQGFLMVVRRDEIPEWNLEMQQAYFLEWIVATSQLLAEAYTRREESFTREHERISEKRLYAAVDQVIDDLGGLILQVHQDLSKAAEENTALKNVHGSLQASVLTLLRELQERTLSPAVLVTERNKRDLAGVCLAIQAYPHAQNSRALHLLPFVLEHPPSGAFAPPTEKKEFSIEWGDEAKRKLDNESGKRSRDQVSQAGEAFVTFFEKAYAKADELLSPDQDNAILRAFVEIFQSMLAIVQDYQALEKEASEVKDDKKKRKIDQRMGWYADGVLITLMNAYEGLRRLLELYENLRARMKAFSNPRDLADAGFLISYHRQCSDHDAHDLQEAKIAAAAPSVKGFAETLEAAVDPKTPHPLPDIMNEKEFIDILRRRSFIEIFAESIELIRVKAEKAVASSGSSGAAGAPAGGEPPSVPPAPRARAEPTAQSPLASVSPPPAAAEAPPEPPPSPADSGAAASAGVPPGAAPSDASGMDIERTMDEAWPESDPFESWSSEDRGSSSGSGGSAAEDALSVDPLASAQDELFGVKGGDDPGNRTALRGFPIPPLAPGQTQVIMGVDTSDTPDTPDLFAPPPAPPPSSGLDTALPGTPPKRKSELDGVSLDGINDEAETEADRFFNR